MPGVYDQATVLQIQQANDIVDVVAEHVSLKKKGREMVGLCPFHEDHRPSLNVNPHKQIFKCFACGAGGDVFKFIQARENLTFGQAIERLAGRAGIPIKATRRAPDAQQQQTSDIDPNRLARLNAWATDYFQANLNDADKGRKAREYLESRKITPESIETWRLGLALNAAGDLARAAAGRKIPTNLLQQAGLTVAPGQDKFVNRLMFTITDVTGRVIGFGGRTLDDTGAKYINSPATPLFDKSNTLYGLEQARHAIVKSGVAIVVEGYTDVIMAHQHGCRNVVATLGTSFTQGHARILRRYAKEIVLVFDSDTAGVAAAGRALEICLSQRIDIRIAFAPQGKDPCDFLATAGKDAFDELIAEAIDVLQFKWDRLAQSLEAERTLAGRRQALEDFFQAAATGLASGNLSAIEKGLIVNRLAGIVGLSSKEVNTDLARRIGRIKRAAAREQQRQMPDRADLGRGVAAAAQQEILEVLLNAPQLFKDIEQTINAADFDVPILGQIAAILFALLQTRTDLELAETLAAAESIEVGNCITELADIGAKKGNYQQRLTAAVEALSGHKAQDQTADTQRLRRNPYSVGMT